MHHSDFISLLADVYQPKSYLELGTYKGETFFKIQQKCPHCIGVDSAADAVGHRMTTQEFFYKNLETFDMIFIDADHNYKAVLSDLWNSMRILNRAGLIILHDTDPATDNLLDPGYCGDAFKILSTLDMPQFHDWTQITLPLSDPGLTLVQRRHDTRMALRAAA